MLLFNNIILLFQTIYIISIEYIKYKLCIINTVQTFKNITSRLSNLNMLYTKILQWVINDSIYENKEMKKILEDFTDNVKYDESDIDYDSLLELLNNNNITLDSFKPINSGTISLVYKGLLDNEKPIIVKMLKKNIKNRLDESIKYFIFLSKITKYIPYINVCNLDKIIVDINDKLKLQINFEEEIKNINKFYNNFEDNKNFMIPKSYDEFTLQNNKIIVMDYINGLNVYSIDQNDKLNFLKILYEFMFECMFNFKIFHGDLHPGNILFIKDSENKLKIGIIDYGIVEEYDDDIKQRVCLFFKKLVKGDDKKLYDYIVNNIGETDNCSNNLLIIDKDKIVNELLKVKEKHNILTNSVKANDIYYINNVLNKHKMILNIKFSKIFLIMSSMYSLLYMLQDDKNGEVFKECFDNYCKNYVFTYLNFIE